jgi:hypothetical protein
VVEDVGEVVGFHGALWLGQKGIAGAPWTLRNHTSKNLSRKKYFQVLRERKPQHC